MSILPLSADADALAPELAPTTQRRRIPWFEIALVVPGLALVLLLVAYPMVLTVWNSFTRIDHGQNAYAWFLENPTYLGILRQTLFTAVLTVGCCLLVGYPFAYLMVLVGPRTRAIMLIIVLVPFWVSGLVRTFAWVILLQGGGPVSQFLPFLGAQGILHTQLAVQIGLVQVLLPFMILPMYNSMRTIDHRLLQAAEGMGARRVVAFMRVFLPLSIPGVRAGALVVYILTLGFYVLPLILGSPAQTLIGNAISAQSELGNQGRAAALSVILLVSAALLVLLVMGVARLWVYSRRPR